MTEYYRVHALLMQMGWIPQCIKRATGNSNLYAVSRNLPGETPVHYYLRVYWDGAEDFAKFSSAELCGPELNLKTKKIDNERKLKEWNTVKGVLRALDAVNNAFGEFNVKKNTLRKQQKSVR